MLFHASRHFGLAGMLLGSLCLAVVGAMAKMVGFESLMSAAAHFHTPIDESKPWNSGDQAGVASVDTRVGRWRSPLGRNERARLKAGASP